MTQNFLTVRRLERRLSTGALEPLNFETGVNVLVGRPNTGKTRWLQTLDYLLGDSGGSPFEGENDEHLAQKYDGASAELIVGGEQLSVERRWNDPGVKRVTHCPACDQSVQSTSTNHKNCFLCHQILPALPAVEGLGAARLRFESNRLTAEMDEANELFDVLMRDSHRAAAEIRASEETLRMVENELAPMRNAVSSLIHEQLSAIDMALGELNERQRQLGRLKRAVASGMALGAKIREKEKEIEPLEAKVNELARATDFGDAEARLAEGMNEYLSAINVLKPGIWRHSRISVDMSRYSFRILVGTKRWQSALGGTDSLYFLMAYHYGLLTLGNKDGCHYPGLSLLDMPAEFAGESIEDKENFIVQPFIDLLQRDQFQGAQVIITGASFAGLQGAVRQRLLNVHVA